MALYHQWKIWKAEGCKSLNSLSFTQKELSFNKENETPLRIPYSDIKPKESSSLNDSSINISLNKNNNSMIKTHDDQEGVDTCSDNQN